MTKHREDALKVLSDQDGDYAAAAAVIYPNRALAVYVITTGLETLRGKERRARRRELKTEIKPQFKPGPVTGSYVFTKATKHRLLRHTQELFGDNGWMIGNLNLGEMTKEQLTAQALQERASARGSIRNAQFYEALAEPLQPGQRADQYWKSATARKIRDEIWKDTEGKSPALV